jgi:hypothetical protein
MAPWSTGPLSTLREGKEKNCVCLRPHDRSENYEPHDEHILRH